MEDMLTCESAKLMTAEFHFVASVQGPRYCACRITATVSLFTGTLEPDRALRSSVTPVLFLQ